MHPPCYFDEPSALAVTWVTLKSGAAVISSENYHLDCPRAQGLNPRLYSWAMIAGFRSIAAPFGHASRAYLLKGEAI